MLHQNVSRGGFRIALLTWYCDVNNAMHYSRTMHFCTRIQVRNNTQTQVIHLSAPENLTREVKLPLSTCMMSHIFVALSSQKMFGMVCGQQQTRMCFREGGKSDFPPLSKHTYVPLLSTHTIWKHLCLSFFLLLLSVDSVLTK